MVQEVGTIASTEDLLIQILLRVPARPLVRFKCVSKHWLSLISDPKFCHRHTLQNPNSSISAVFPRTSAYIALSFIPLDLDHDLRSSHGNQNLSGSPNCNPLNFVQNHEIMIIQSCNGLFLCCPLAKRSKPPYYVLNPTTNQFSTLNPPAAAATSGQPCLILGQALAFDPSKSPHYKVLFLCRENYYSDFHIEIYSSETQSWRLVDSSFNMARQGVRYDEGVYCNGAVHWVGLHKELSYYHIDDERVRHVFEPDRHVFSLGLEPFEWFEFRTLWRPFASY
ncbi:putative F-box domain-containing protein [Rosa chinensis]|uniref:Putative F-box domain-containing protein n=1 Tax=Rosa chinensis TaxID=74649 RepID=A0A2P6PP48_ROSCH|nr:F-box protein At5g07610 [Rosa chinensis]PRQ23698.1 putative F-box domain-containing protein [Rosa chinensis]